MTKVLDVRGLQVGFGERPAVRGIDLSIAPGECLALIGASGSGKSVSARALLGLAGEGAEVTAERMRLGELDLLPLGRRGRAARGVRGGRIGFVLQDALVSLDPARTIGHELRDTIRIHHPQLSRPAIHARALALLQRVGLPEPELRMRQRATALSGGQRQRALIAVALAGDPELLIADEPTTALDAAARRALMSLLNDLAGDGLAILLISHDLASVRLVADRISVMAEGEIVEAAPTATLLAHPRSTAAAELVAALPHAPHRRPPLTGPVRLRAEGLTKWRRRPDGSMLAALDGAHLELHEGEVLGVVGASGSGKSTLARLLLALERPDAGTVRLDEAPWSTLPPRAQRPLRPRIQLIAQDPLSSFDPRRRVGAILADALSGGRTRRPRAERARILALLAEVGLDARTVTAFPRHLSGGQRQRVAIARALATNPEVLVADEAVSALDAHIRRHIIDLLMHLRDTRNLSCVFISHDLDVVAEIADRIAVMAAGRIVETAPALTLLREPAHAATRALLGQAVPEEKSP